MLQRNKLPAKLFEESRMTDANMFEDLDKKTLIGVFLPKKNNKIRVALVEFKDNWVPIPPNGVRTLLSPEKLIKIFDSKTKFYQYVKQHPDKRIYANGCCWTFKVMKNFSIT